MSTYIRTATVLVRVNTGSPTWWWPKVALFRHGDGILQLRFGWLRACVQIGIGSKRHPEEEA